MREIDDAKINERAARLAKIVADIQLDQALTALAIAMHVAVRKSPGHRLIHDAVICEMLVNGMLAGAVGASQTARELIREGAV